MKRNLTALVVLLATCHFYQAQVYGTWEQNGTNLHNGEGNTLPVIRYSDSMNLYYLLSADSIVPSQYRMDTLSVFGGEWGLLNSTVVANDFVVMDNGDLIFAKFVNGTLEIEATNPLGQSLWNSSPPSQTFSGMGNFDIKIFKGLTDDVYVSAYDSGDYATYKYANQTWEEIGQFFTRKIEFLSNGEPVIGSYVSDMTPGAQWITYKFHHYDGANWTLLDSVQFTQEEISGFDFCVNKFDSIYLMHSTLVFLSSHNRIFRVNNFSATQVGTIYGSSTTANSVYLTSDLLGDLHGFISDYDLGWYSMRHVAFDAGTYAQLGGGQLLNGEEGTSTNLSHINSPMSTCVDEFNCVGFAVAQHTDFFQNFGPDTIYVNTKKFCSCKYTDSENTTSEQNNTLFANNQSFTSYQWLDCTNDYAIIPGANDTQFTPTTNGSYAVEVTMNGCTDTSECQMISTIGIGEISASSAVRIYPNPATTNLKIQLNEASEASVQIVDVFGKVVLSTVFLDKVNVLDVSKLSRGVYILRVKSDSYVKNHSFMKI